MSHVYTAIEAAQLSAASIRVANKLFIIDYYDRLINQMDIEFETLLAELDGSDDPGDIQRSDEINLFREEMLTEIHVNQQANSNALEEAIRLDDGLSSRSFNFFGVK